MNADYSTHYLGLTLKSPLVVAACPLTSELDVLRRIADEGAGAAVLPSLFEEQLGSAGGGSWNDYQGASPHHYRELMQYNHGPDAYLRYLERAKHSVSMPLFASLNGSTAGGWLDFARRIEQAGADALELNLMVLPVDANVSAAEIEGQYEDIVRAVRSEVKIPLAVKLAPYFTSLPNLVCRLVAAGADGVVLFNRHLQPDINLSSRRVVAHVTFSSPQELALRLRWLGILYGRVPTSLAATGGVGCGLDVLKAVAAGADVVQVASVLYRQGIDVLGQMRRDYEHWLAEHEYPSIKSLKGILSQLCCADPAAFARANYTRAISSFVTDAV